VIPVDETASTADNGWKSSCLVETAPPVIAFVAIAFARKNSFL
jgi:hypothetical protein